MNPVTDAVAVLFETVPFRRWKSIDENYVLRAGKPVPILSVLAPEKKT